MLRPMHYAPGALRTERRERRHVFLHFFVLNEQLINSERTLNTSKRRNFTSIECELCAFVARNIIHARPFSSY
jgi:hypothetical protein